MPEDSYLTSLQSYIQSLQKQLKAQSIEQETLHRALDENQQQLSKIDVLYLQKEQLTRANAILTEQLEKMSQFVREANKAIIDEKGRTKKQEKIAQLEQELKIHRQVIEELEGENQSICDKLSATEQELQKIRTSYSSLEQNHSTIGCQVRYLSEEIKNKNSQIRQLQTKLQQLSQNYIHVESALIEKDEQLYQCQQENSKLRQQLDAVQFQMSQKNIMINCLEDELEEAQQTFGAQAEDQCEVMLKDIQKIDLVRHNNHLVERIHYLELENRGIPSSTPRNPKLYLELQRLKEEFETLSTQFE